MSRRLPAFWFSTTVLLAAAAVRADDLPPAPTATPAFAEDWSTGRIDPAKWYLPRKKWGDAQNHGVVPENVRIARDTAAGRERNVLICEAHGDQYDGPVVGQGGVKTRVGGMIVSRAFFASGRYEIVLKVGGTTAEPGGPTDPRHPAGAIPAIWTYAYRYVAVPSDRANDFVPATPLYNPLMKRYRGNANEYWSEIDFPEFGKGGNFRVGLYNTFLQNRHESKAFDVVAGTDGQYHTFTTDWRTHLVPLTDVNDAQVTQAEGFYWINDKSIPFERYYGNPLRRVGPNQYALYEGERVDHWIDGKQVAENTKYVPAMAAQLTLGIWLPDWAGKAPWRTSSVSIASVKIWPHHDEGDVEGILTGDLKDNFDKQGKPIR